RHAVQLGRETLLQAREEALPEGQRAAHQVFPEAALRFVDAQGNAAFEKRPTPAGTETLFVERMARFVEGAEEKPERLARIEPRGDPHIARARRRGKWVSRLVLSATRPVEPEAGHDLDAEIPDVLLRVREVEHGVVDLMSVDQRLDE